MNPVIIVNNPGYTSFQKKLVEIAFEKVKECPLKNKSRIVSFLTRHQRIISYGVNNESITHTLANKISHFKKHAELSNFMKVRWFNLDYRKCRVYNIRIRRNNSITMARPCNHCMEFLSLIGIKKITYTDWNGVFREEYSL